MFQIVYCEYDRFNSDYDRIYRPKGDGTYLLLLFLKPMKVYLKGELSIARPGACLLYTPEYGQDYSAVKEFQNSYVHFQAYRKDLEEMNIPLNQIFYPEHIDVFDIFFRRIQEEYLKKEKNSDQMMDALLRQMLILISRQLSGGNIIRIGEEGIYQEFQKARLNLLAECEKAWDIVSMCELVHLEKSQFYSYYDKFFGISPKADLLKARMEKAKNLLTNEALQVQQVAEICGFTNASHFTRQFKKQFGCAPKEFCRK